MLVASGAGNALAQTAAPRSGYKPDVREQVKAGKFHACVSDSVSRDQAQPRLVFQNSCDTQVNVSLCVRVANAAPCP